MIKEIVVAVLACARIGAVHNVVFGGFSADSICERVLDSGCKMIITQDLGVRGPKFSIPMYQNAAESLTNAPCLESILVVRRVDNSEVNTLVDNNGKS
mmetsp:Transcript_53228/g.116205  ORF Transcript_53228/g.116205 Transcript_53228/m.116205 type:complete len:98 (+) Transcript_53228:475-768(+)